MTAPPELSKSDAPSELLTVPEVCDRLRISRWTFYRLIQQRELRSVTIGRSRRITQQALADYIEHLQAQELEL